MKGVEISVDSLRINPSNTNTDNDIGEYDQGMLNRKNETKSPHGHFKFKDEGTPNQKTFERMEV